jgi:hypothetical protein
MHTLGKDMRRAAYIQMLPVIIYHRAVRRLQIILYPRYDWPRYICYICLLDLLLNVERDEEKRKIQIKARLIYFQDSPTLYFSLPYL